MQLSIIFSILETSSLTAACAIVFHPSIAGRSVGGSERYARNKRRTAPLFRMTYGWNTQASAEIAQSSPQNEIHWTVPQNTRQMQVSDDAFIARDLLHFNHHPNISVYYTGGVVMDLDEHLQDMRLTFSTYSDIAPHNHDYRILFGEGDWTVALSQFTGTNDGPLPNATGALLSPTMRTVKADLMTIARWNGGLMMEEYLWSDVPKMWRQLGLLPTRPAADLPDLELSPYTAPLSTQAGVDSSAANKGKMRQTEDAFNAGKFDAESMNLSPNITVYGFNDEGLGLQGFLNALSSYKTAFPDLALENRQTIGQGDWTATTYNLSGTHQGPLTLPPYLADEPVAATNKSFNLTFGILGALAVPL